MNRSGGRESARGGAAMASRLMRWLTATRRAQFTAGLTCALLFGVFFGALVVANIRSQPPASAVPDKRASRPAPPVPVPVRVRVTEQPVPSQPPASQLPPPSGIAERAKESRTVVDARSGAVSETPAAGPPPAISRIPENVENNAPARPPAAKTASVVAAPPVNAEPAKEAASPPVPETVSSRIVEDFGPAVLEKFVSKAAMFPAPGQSTGPAKAAPAAVQTAALTPKSSADPKPERPAAQEILVPNPHPHQSRAKSRLKRENRTHRLRSHRHVKRNRREMPLPHRWDCLISDRLSRVARRRRNPARKPRYRFRHRRSPHGRHWRPSRMERVPWRSVPK